MAGRTQSHNRYEQMLARSATAAICAGPDNTIVSWNLAAETLLGYSAEEALGKPLSIIIPERLRAAHDAGLARAAKAGRARLAGQAVEVLALHAEGHELPVDLSLSMWFEDGRPMFGALLRDVTDRSRTQRQLEHLAHCDTLTSLPNRNALQTCLHRAIADGRCALLMLDLDGFKHVNDTLGHTNGDTLLVSVAKRLKDAVDDDHFVARLGGDEFAIVVFGQTDPCALHELCERIRDQLTRPIELAGQAVFVDSSIGIAMTPEDASTAEELLCHADLALYSAKALGGHTRSFFTRAMQRQSEQRHRLGIELRKASESKEFELLYQPQIRIADRTLVGVEALLRWRHPVHGVLQPSIFIDTLENSPIAEEVGDWVLDEACAAAAVLRSKGLRAMRVAVNLFSRQLRSGRLYESVTAALERHGLEASCLELEITENTVLQFASLPMQDLRRLKALGVQVAFDDFGTGFASLSLLQKYPVTRLKIDRSFVAKIDSRAADSAIVGAIITMAQKLGLRVTAEGVETAEQEAVLQSLQCDEAQGFRYGSPMTATELVRHYSPAIVQNA
ncbi:MAG: EAL domain-containing protein [Sphingomonadaceae bacterium]